MSSTSSFSPARAALALLTSLLLATPALADRPGDRGGPHGRGHDHAQNDERDRGDNRGDYRGPDGRGDRAGVVIVFDDRSRGMVDDYYAHRPGKGRCPPGLAKKHNGCQPPGQARRWQRGHPLPRDLRPVALPYELRHRLPPPPQGYRYVQVASDILLVAIGTQMVVDAIEDIVR